MNGSGRSRGSSRGPILLATILPVLLLAPFLDKAFHIDDPLFVYSAQHLTEHPLDFYGFSINWYTSPMPMHEVNQNPPLLAYYLAPFGLLFGWCEWVVHGALLLPAAAVGLGTWLVARRCCRHPLAATLLVILSPVFLVSGSTVMCDLLMLGFWLWALHLWLLGVERKHWGYFWVSGILIASSALSKYFGVSLIPLLFVYTLVAGRGTRHAVLYLLVPVAILGLYEFATARLYGRGLLWDAVVYARDYQATEGLDYLEKAVTGLTFTGACLAPVALFGMVSWWRWSKWACVGLLGVGVAVLPALSAYAGLWDDPPTPLPWWARIQAGLWGLLGGYLLILALTDLVRRRDAASVVLALWFGGVLFFACFVNHFVNARVILPLAVPGTLLAVRHFEQRVPRGTEGSSLVPRAVFLLAGALALLVSCADARLAGIARHAAEEIGEEGGGGAVWFSGHWGFHYYMAEQGGRPLDLGALALQPGDLCVTPSNNTNRAALQPEMVEERETLQFRSFPCLATMQRPMGAGFYSDVFGPLPFVIGPVPAEMYTVDRVAGPRALRKPGVHPVP